MKHIVAISTGHSIPSPGVTAINGMYEHELNTILVEKLLEYHIPHGNWFRADHDCEDLRYPKHLLQTIRNINAQGCVCAIELHHNTTVKHNREDSEILYWDTSQQGYLLAKRIADAFTKNLREMHIRPNLKFLGKRKVKAFLKRTNCPAVIVEPAFIDVAAGVMWVEANYSKIASAIYEGLVAWLKNE
jgi:N-acetylmuramoyl-L-alanine amidase